MIKLTLLPAALLVLSLSSPVAQEGTKGYRLEQYTSADAAKLLVPEAVVVLPLGAALEEHGPHLRLRNDLTLAEYLADRVGAAAPVVIAPPLTYHFYPAPLDYPGSAGLGLDTARDFTMQVVRSLARSGPRRFYVLDTGISTSRALAPAAAILAREGILLRYTDLRAAVERLSGRGRQQEAAAHADEMETSMMLYIDETSADMRLAARGAGLASREKGRLLVEGVVATVLRDIEALRAERLPAAAAPPVAPARTAPGSPDIGAGRNGCLPGVERDIKRVEAAFNAHWNNRDAISFGGMWTEEGDLMHGDGSLERGSRTITSNRIEQFKSREYRDARHSLTFTFIRCVSAAVAVVDAKWELRDVLDAAGKTLPRADGFATLVLQGGDGRWGIEAYRYNTKPGAPAGPTLLKKPGYPDK